MDKGFQGTIIRVKRKRNEEPLDALTVLASATANHPQVLAPKQKKGRGFKSLSLESSTDEVTEQKDGAVSSAPETTSNATTSENIPGPNSAVDGEGGGGTAPLVFRLMDTIGLRDSSTQAARLKRGIRRSHRASRVKRGSESDAGTGTETNLSTAEELVADSQEKRRENSKTGRSQAKQAVFDKRRSDFSSGVTSSVAEEEGSIGEGTFEATAAAVTSPSVQTKAAGDPSSATKASSGSPFRPVFKPPTKKPSAARGPATTKPNAETLSGGKDSGYVAGSGMARGSLTFHMLEVQVPPKQRVLPPHPPASDATQPPRIALNGQPMHAIKTAGKHHASSGLAASTKPSVDANGALAPAKSSLAVKTPAAAATSPSSSSTPTRVLNPWESRMDQAVFAAFQSGVDASGVARALDACSGAHSSRVIQVSCVKIVGFKSNHCLTLLCVLSVSFAVSYPSFFFPCFRFSGGKHGTTSRRHHPPHGGWVVWGRAPLCAVAQIGGGPSRGRRPRSYRMAAVRAPGRSSGWRCGQESCCIGASCSRRRGVRL